MSLIYRRSIAVLDKIVPQKLQPLWNHEAGPKTVFFWAPVVKWGLVLAGIGDLTRPAEKLSVSQSGSLTATGFIWARYSLVIIPKNWSLFSVNMFVGGTNVIQLIRALKVAGSGRPEGPSNRTDLTDKFKKKTLPAVTKKLNTFKVEPKHLSDLLQDLTSRKLSSTFIIISILVKFLAQ